MKHLVYLALMLVLSACSNNSPQQLNQQDSIPEEGDWADAAINHYLESNLSRWETVDGLPVLFMKEPQIINHKNYCRVNIGHNLEERFETIQIIYVDSLTKAVFEYDAENDSLIPWPQQAIKDDADNEIPINGTYQFDIAHAEWKGQSMGEQVKLVIKDGSIKVIYKDDVIEEGKIMKHKTGVWIIGKHTSDALLDEIGGCTDGPPIIDFKEKKFWLC